MLEAEGASTALSSGSSRPSYRDTTTGASLASGGKSLSKSPKSAKSPASGGGVASRFWAIQM